MSSMSLTTNEITIGAKRIAILWKHVTGYLQAAVRALLSHESSEVFLVQSQQQMHARFEPLEHARCRFVDLSDPSYDHCWLQSLVKFSPDLVLISPGKNRHYLEAAILLKRQGCMVIWVDDRVLRAPLQDTYQMILGRVLKKWRNFDAAFVPGVAASRYARWIGIAEERVFQGLYSCDNELFGQIGRKRHEDGTENPWPLVFLFVGQFIERKGVPTLLEAYRRYRELSVSPWELWCVGEGPLGALFEGERGVTQLGFLPPHECAVIMGQSGALVLPSRWDHWPLVIHEASCAGLPIIASDRCMSHVDLIQDGRNGYIFPVGDESLLVRLMLKIASGSRAREMGANSYRLSSRFSLEFFSRQVLEHIPAKLEMLREV